MLKSMKMVGMATVFASAIIGLEMEPANAAVYKYEFSGNTFDPFADPYTSSMSVSGHFLVELPVVENLLHQDLSSDIVSFSFSDGVQTIDDSTILTLEYFAFGTNNLGEISTWFIDLVTFPGGDRILTRSGQACYDFVQSGGGDACSNTAGTMSGPTLVAPVPLPAALPLLMSALGFFGFMGWRRKRHTAA